MIRLIEFFSKQHLFSNFLFIIVVAGGILYWHKTSKEELPNITMDLVLVTTSYPGASASEIEMLVTWPLEKELQNIDGIETIRSTSSEGKSLITLELDKYDKNRSNTVSDIRNAVLSVRLPEEIIDLPEIRELKSSRKPIMDIGIYWKDVHLLQDKERQQLQKIAHALENRLLALPHVNTISRSGYLQEELRIEIFPDKMQFYQIPFTSIVNDIKKSNIRQPAGSLENLNRDRISLDAELRQEDQLRKLPMQGTFSSALVRLEDIATIKDSFEETQTIMKINGHEGIQFKIRKSTRFGIIETVDAVKREMELFRQTNPSVNLEIVAIDDESRDVRNRISLIQSNGLIGFLLILFTLFFFLNFKTGFWVAMGIPFSLAATMIAANWYGLTINNMTLAAVIIVMGMVVDDAIVVSENILRLQDEGVPLQQAVVEGTAYVTLPITASVLTTIVAFLPILAFEGRLAMLTDSIPPIVAFMLLASLVESLIILPAHMKLEFSRPWRIAITLGGWLLVEHLRRRWIRQGSSREKVKEMADNAAHWFARFEYRYSRLLARALHFRYITVTFFIFITIAGSLIYIFGMRFVLFPREESTEMRLAAEAPVHFRKDQTAAVAADLEAVVLKHLGKEVMNVRTMIGITIFNYASQENRILMRIEVVPGDQRKLSTTQLAELWIKKMKKVPNIKKVRFSNARFGMDSGSPIEVVIQENDHNLRKKIADALSEELMKIPSISNTEIGESFQSPEYRLRLKRDLLKRLEVNPADLSLALRASLEGIILYRILSGDEEKNIRLTFAKKDKQQFAQISAVAVPNLAGYMIPLNELISHEKVKDHSEIQRLNRMRSLIVYADLHKNATMTPLEVATYLEKNIFPKLTRLSPNALFTFDGEIKISRESSSFFPVAIASVIFLIFMILALQFNSMLNPLIIMASIPPAAASVILVFFLHGMNYLGFFGIIGILGLSGVVVNDAIVLLSKLQDKLPVDNLHFTKSDLYQIVAEQSATRLKAVTLTTLTTVAGLFPTAYGWLGYDSMLAEMMLALSWGLVFGTLIILLLIPSIYMIILDIRYKFKK